MYVTGPVVDWVWQELMELRDEVADIDCGAASTALKLIARMKKLISRQQEEPRSIFRNRTFVAHYKLATFDLLIND